MNIRKIFAHIRWLSIPFIRFYIQHSPFPYGKKMLWETVSWRKKEYSTCTFFGSKIKGSTNDLVQGYIYYFGIWEPNLTSFVQNRLTGLKNRTFIDIGANIGYYSLLGAKCMPGGNIVSIEAFPSIYQKLLENININNYSNIRAVNCAATNSTHTVSIYYAGETNEGATTTSANKFSTTSVEVEGRPLSNILSENEVKSTRLIKMDVEGAEYLAFTGMLSLFKKFPDDIEIVIEITPSVLDKNEMNEIFSSFEQIGFFPYVLFNTYDPDYYLFSQKIYPLARMKNFPLTQTDIIFSRIDADFLA